MSKKEGANMIVVVFALYVAWIAAGVTWLFPGLIPVPLWYAMTGLGVSILIPYGISRWLEKNNYNSHYQHDGYPGWWNRG